MALSAQDITALATEIKTEWGLSTITNAQTLLETAVTLSDSILGTKCPTIYVGDLTPTTPKEVLFCLLRKLFSVNLFFKHNPNVLADFTFGKNLSSVSNPDAGSASFAGKHSFSIEDLRSQIVSIMKNLGIQTLEQEDPRVKITVNNLI